MKPEIMIHDLWVRIFFSIVCGLSIGLERQIRGKPVGIRTSILICLGTMLFIFLGLEMDNGHESVRILGQVVTGVGFLGAGVIMNKEGLVSGVTSASVVWLLAGIGAAIGLELFDVAVTITGVALCVLIGAESLETVFKILQRGVHQHKKNE
ncbi:MAG: MgtC/SapB family protein [Candidatus Omnitrophota bacterium]